MGLTYTDEQRMLSETAHGFMGENAPVSHLRALRDDGNKDGFCRDLWAQFGEMGFASILIPEDEGGMGLGHVEAGIVMEAIGRNLTPSPLLTTAIGGVTALKAGPEDVRSRWYPEIAAGKAVLALALDEGKKHAPDRIETVATKDGNGYRLSGTKAGAVMAHAADAVIVSARIDGEDGDEAVGLFLVPTDAGGLSMTTERLVDTGFASDLTLDGVNVDGSARLSGGVRTLNAALRAVQAGASAELVGIADGAFEETTEYLRSRTQFGVPVGSFQALQHRAASLYGEIDMARAASLKARSLLDRGDPQAERAVAVAKSFAGSTASLATREGVQLHGGIGMTDAHDIGFTLKRAQTLGELFGDAYYHAEWLAKESGY